MSIQLTINLALTEDDEVVLDDALNLVRFQQAYALKKRLLRNSHNIQGRVNRCLDSFMVFWHDLM
jgi:hypothetical protein